MADTDALIQQALKEEEAERKRAKREKAQHGAHVCLFAAMEAASGMFACSLGADRCMLGLAAGAC